MDGGAWKSAVHGVAEGRTPLNHFTFTFHFYTLEKEMATHSSVLAWRTPGMGEPSGLPSMGSHRVGHDWSDLAAVQFSHSVMSNSLWPHGLEHARPPLSITNSQNLLKHTSIESVMPSNHLILCHPLLLLPSIFSTSGSFQISQLFASGGQNIGVSASTSELPMNT